LNEIELSLPGSPEARADEQQTQENTIQHGTEFAYKSGEDSVAVQVIS